MPYMKKKSYRPSGKKYGKKRTYTKKWARKKQIKKNSNRVLSKFRVIHEIDSEGGFANGWISLSNLLYSKDSTNVANTEYNNYAALYDSVRPCGVKIKWIPKDNVNTTSSYKPLYTAQDYNDTLFTAPLTTINKATILEYNNMKYKNAYRPQKWYFKLKKQPQNLSLLPRTDEPARGDVLIEPQSKFGYFSVNNMQGVDPSGAVTAKDVQAIWPNAGIFYFYLDVEGFADEVNLGTFMVTYYYAFTQRR